MRRSALSLLLLAAGLGSACGARSSLSASQAGASGTGGASSGTGGASSSVTSTSAGGASSSSSGVFPEKVWSRRRAGTLATRPLSVDAEGHIWLLGGTHPHEAGYPKDWTSAHLWKLSPEGDTEIDATYDGGKGFHVFPQVIHADAAGGVLLAGQAFREPGAASTLDVGGAAVSFPFAESAFLVKLDAAGKHVWSNVYQAGDSGTDVFGRLGFLNVGADAAGRWHILTYAYGPTNLGAGTVNHDGPIVLVLSPAGEHLSDVLLPDEGWVSSSFAVEPSGHTWLAGGASQCNYGLKVQRFDPAGNLLAAACPPSTCWVESVDIALDGAGGVFVTDSSGGADHCDQQIFLRRMDASGNVTWALHGQTGMYSTTVAATPAGHAVMGSSFYGPFELGSGPLASPVYEDDTEVILGDVDPGGEVLSAAHYGGKGEQRMVATAVDPVAARVIAGQISGVVDFGDGPQDSASEDPGDSLFIARIPQ